MNEHLGILGFTSDEIVTLLKGDKIEVPNIRGVPSFVYYIDKPFLKVDRYLDSKLVKTGIIKLL